MGDSSMKPTLYNAVHKLVGGQLSGSTDDYDTFKYHDGQTPPTKEEAEAKLAEMISEWEAQEYARKRQAEYPSTGDQLDYIFHNGVAKWKTDIIEPVKTKWPKDNSGPVEEEESPE